MIKTKTNIKIEWNYKMSGKIEGKKKQNKIKNQNKCQ